MSTIFHIMKEEYQRLAEAERIYRNNIEQMPKGSPRIKHIRNGDYLYLARREGKKVIYQYIGPKNSKKANNTMEQINKRERFAQFLKEIKASLKDIRKVLRGKI